MKTLSTMLLAAVLFLAACQYTTPIRIRERKLKLKGEPANTSIFLLSKAVDARKKPTDRVGKHLITFFMIPGPHVVAAGGVHLDEAVANHTKTALETAGYTVTTVDHIEDALGPVLVVQIDDWRNYNYGWIWPIAFIWGKMNATVLLVSPQEDMIWKAQTKGHGGYWMNLVPWGFGMRVKSDLTANLNQIIEICSSNEFKDALRQAQASTL